MSSYAPKTTKIFLLHIILNLKVLTQRFFCDKISLKGTYGENEHKCEVKHILHDWEEGSQQIIIFKLALRAC